MINDSHPHRVLFTYWSACGIGSALHAVSTSPGNISTGSYFRNGLVQTVYWMHESHLPRGCKLVCIFCCSCLKYWIPVKFVVVFKPKVSANIRLACFVMSVESLCQIKLNTKSNWMHDEDKLIAALLQKVSSCTNFDEWCENNFPGVNIFNLPAWGAQKVLCQSSCFILIWWSLFEGVMWLEHYVVLQTAQVDELPVFCEHHAHSYPLL